MTSIEWWPWDGWTTATLGVLMMWCFLRALAWYCRIDDAMGLDWVGTRADLLGPKATVQQAFPHDSRLLRPWLVATYDAEGRLEHVGPRVPYYVLRAARPLLELLSWVLLAMYGIVRVASGLPPIPLS